MAALALANGRSPTRWLDRERLFIQRLAIGTEPDTIAAVLRLLDDVQWQHHAEWTVNTRCVTIDSAEFGSAIHTEAPPRVELSPGRYLVRCAYVTPAHVDIFGALIQLVPVNITTL